MHFGLHFGRPVPAPVFDHGLEHPEYRRRDGRDDDEDREPLEHLFPHAQRLRAGILRLSRIPELVLDVLQIVSGVLHDRRVRLQKGCKGRIRRQIGLVPHQRGVDPHHPTHGRRQPLEDVLEVRAGFPCILLVGDQNLGFGRLWPDSSAGVAGRCAACANGESVNNRTRTTIATRRRDRGYSIYDDSSPFYYAGERSRLTDRFSRTAVSAPRRPSAAPPAGTLPGRPARAAGGPPALRGRPEQSACFAES